MEGYGGCEESVYLAERATLWRECGTRTLKTGVLGHLLAGRRRSRVCPAVGLYSPTYRMRRLDG